eukprot:tig00000912_g5457.t1
MPDSSSAGGAPGLAAPRGGSRTADLETEPRRPEIETCSQFTTTAPTACLASVAGMARMTNMAPRETCYPGRSLSVAAEARRWSCTLSLPGPLSRTHGLPSDVGSHEKNVRERETSEDASPEPRAPRRSPLRRMPRGPWWRARGGTRRRVAALGTAAKRRAPPARPCSSP